MPLHRLQNAEYAEYMQKYAQIWKKVCRKYAWNMQNMHKSMQWHIFCITAWWYIHDTRMHSPLWWWLCWTTAVAATPAAPCDSLSHVHGGLSLKLTPGMALAVLSHSHWQGDCSSERYSSGSSGWGVGWGGQKFVTICHMEGERGSKISQKRVMFYLNFHFQISWFDR